MLIWIKINDEFGFVGMSKGDTILDIDNHFDDDYEIKSLTGLTWGEICTLNPANYLTIKLNNCLKANGLVERPDLSKSNGQVNAYCFEIKN